MEIGILGTGNVGSALADGFTAAGHDVVVGSRSPDDADVDGVEVTTQAGAAAAADAVVLALPGEAVVDVAADLADSLAGKPVLDPTNEYPERSSEPSLAAHVAEAAPDAHVVKVFNTIGAEHMRDPEVGGETATMFLAGDDSAVETAETLAGDLGFDTFVVGDLSKAARLEDLARLWIDVAFEQTRNVAFRFLRG
jgi:hypothetical protein